MSVNYNVELLEVAIKAAFESGKLLKSGLEQNFEIKHKDGVNNLVTEYDHKSEEIIFNIISDKFPDHSFLAEESGVINKSTAHHNTVKWIIDPLDGTVNFANKLPIFSVSIAAELSGEILCGVVYQPVTGELFSAAKGNGAFLNNKEISVSNKSNFETSFLVTGFPYNISDNPEENLKDFIKIIGMGIPVRRLGSAALDLAYVACGRFDAFWEKNLNPWDVAAGALIVKEAGGLVTNYDNQILNIYDKSIIASNHLIHNNLLDIIRQ